MSPIMHLLTYQRIASHVHDASIVCMDQCYNKAIEAVRVHYCEMDKTLDSDSVILSLLVMMVKYTNKPDPSDPTYEQWCVAHKPDCTKNFDGSFTEIEVEAAKVIFGRSVNKPDLS